MELWAIVIASLISPLFLKLTEYVLNKSSQKERDAALKNKERDDKITALGKRVDELRADNIKLTLKTETQQLTIDRLEAQAAIDKQTIITQAQQIVELRAEVGVRDGRILELEHRVNLLAESGAASGN
jgi:hypothetical protein